MNTSRGIVFSWLPIAIAVTGLCGLVELTVQQSYRHSLNDPQIQLAEDAARLIAAGIAANMLIPNGGKVDMDASLAPWMALYDAQRTPLASSALLNNTVPQIPEGVFSAAAKSGENRVTWQPQPGVRQAIVVVKAGDKGFAVAGRNMREVENRESQLLLIVGLAWAVTLVATYVAVYAVRRFV